MTHLARSSTEQKRDSVLTSSCGAAVAEATSTWVRTVALGATTDCFDNADFDARSAWDGNAVAGGGDSAEATNARYGTAESWWFGWSSRWRLDVENNATSGNTRCPLAAFSTF